MIKISYVKANSNKHGHSYYSMLLCHVHFTDHVVPEGNRSHPMTLHTKVEAVRGKVRKGFLCMGKLKVNAFCIFSWLFSTKYSKKQEMFVFNHIWTTNYNSAVLGYIQTKISTLVINTGTHQHLIIMKLCRSTYANPRCPWDIIYTACVPLMVGQRQQRMAGERQWSHRWYHTFLSSPDLQSVSKIGNWKIIWAAWHDRVSARNTHIQA